MQTLSRSAVARITPQSACTGTGLAYTEIGDDYRKYADGNSTDIYAFDSRYGYADRQVWAVLDETLMALRATGAERVQVLDAGCGPGTWLRRIAWRAHALGFRRISARGFDIAAGQIERARWLSSDLADLKAFDGLEIEFDVGDITDVLPEGTGTVDITLCLYGVLNHIRADKLPGVMRELARVTTRRFVTTVRAAGSPPTIFVEGIEHACRFRHDQTAETFDVELDDGRRLTLDLRLFAAEDLRRLVSPHFELACLRGLDLFHTRFSLDPRWNPASLSDSHMLSDALVRLEEQYGSDPSFIDRAAHLLLVATPRSS